MTDAYKIELVYRTLQNAKDMICEIYRPENKTYGSPSEDITDEKIQKYFYDINSMCCELSDRNVMKWQQEDNE